MFLSENEMAEEVYSRLSMEDTRVLRECKESDLIRFHMSVGMSIRNRFDLWDAANPHVNHQDHNSHYHPDQISQRVIEEVWRKVKNADFLAVSAPFSFTNDESKVDAKLYPSK